MSFPRNLHSDNFLQKIVCILKIVISSLINLHELSFHWETREWPFYSFPKSFQQIKHYLSIIITALEFGTFSHWAPLDTFFLLSVFSAWHHDNYCLFIYWLSTTQSVEWNHILYLVGQPPLHYTMASTNIIHEMLDLGFKRFHELCYFHFKGLPGCNGKVVLMRRDGHGVHPTLP